MIRSCDQRLAWRLARAMFGRAVVITSAESPGTSSRAIEAQASALLGAEAEADCGHIAKPTAQLASELLNQGSDYFDDEYLADVLDDVQADEVPPAEQLVEASRRILDKLMMDTGMYELDVAQSDLEWLVRPDFRLRITRDPQEDGRRYARRVIEEAANQLAIEHLETLSKEERSS